MALYNIGYIKNSSFYSQFIKHKVCEYPGLSQVCLKLTNDADDILGKVQLSCVPANCGTLFMHEVYTYRQPSTGVGTELVKAALRAAELGRYTSLECVVPANCTNMIKILDKLGFVELVEWSYRNMRSANTLKYFQKKLGMTSYQWGQLLKPDISYVLPLLAPAIVLPPVPEVAIPKNPLAADPFKPVKRPRAKKAVSMPPEYSPW